jgi:villin 1
VRWAPGDVDPSRREAGLSEAEFASLFGMTKTEFYKLAQWRQKQLKKEKGLF